MPANLVPLSDTGWTVVLWVTVALAVAWVVGVVLATRYQMARGMQDPPVDAQSPHEPSAGKRISARTLLVVAVTVAGVALVVFLLGRVGDLLA